MPLTGSLSAAGLAEFTGFDPLPVVVALLRISPDAGMFRLVGAVPGRSGPVIFRE